MKDQELLVIEGISVLIFKTLNALNSEQRYPGGDADRMDENLKDLKERYLKLVKIRTDFELTVSGVVGFN